MYINCEVTKDHIRILKKQIRNILTVDRGYDF